jgi:PAS domain S-box-containing protein
MSFLAAFKGRLRDRRFWVVQAMVAAVTTFHYLAEFYEVRTNQEVDKLYLITMYTIYLLPIIYASLNFGREGAIPTAIWMAMLVVPNIVFIHHGNDRIFESVQILTMITLAAVIATRVDREVVQRRRAEAEGAARRVSELKYQSLFDNAGQAIVVFDNEGVIHEVNSAAASLFGLGQRDLDVATLKGALGSDAAASVEAPGDVGQWIGQEFHLAAGQGETWLEPVCTRLSSEEDGLTLALFRDVTARRGFQSYAREIVRAQEDERQRIARDLHDVSLQNIVLLCRRLDEVEEAAEDLIPDQLSKALSGARGFAESIGDELRRFSRDLRPSVLDDLGLVPAIRGLVAELGSRSGIQARFAYTGAEGRLDSNCKVSLFRICQEALRNVERHSGASRATVRLAMNAESVLLTITDNGHGFTLPQSMTNLPTAGRLGLLGMHERATLAGGECEVSSQPGKGTRVQVRLPTCWPDTGQIIPDAVASPRNQRN